MHPEVREDKTQKNFSQERKSKSDHLRNVPGFLKCIELGKRQRARAKRLRLKT